MTTQNNDFLLAIRCGNCFYNNTDKCTYENKRNRLYKNDIGQWTCSLMDKKFF